MPMLPTSDRVWVMVCHVAHVFGRVRGLSALAFTDAAAPIGCMGDAFTAVDRTVPPDHTARLLICCRVGRMRFPVRRQWSLIVLTRSSRGHGVGWPAFAGLAIGDLDPAGPGRDASTKRVDAMIAQTGCSVPPGNSRDRTAHQQVVPIGEVRLWHPHALKPASSNGHEQLPLARP